MRVNILIIVFLVFTVVTSSNIVSAEEMMKEETVEEEMMTDDMEEGGDMQQMTPYDSVFEEVAAMAKDEGGVKLITYDQFQQIKASGEDYVLIDVLGKDSYAQGHLPGAVSLPLGKINEQTVSEIADKGDNVIVYCGGFQCKASTKSAEMLQSLGYAKVLDYKGGLQEYVQKGNKLEK